MSIIKKNSLITTTVFPNKQGKIKYWVDIQPDQIEIKVYSNEDIGNDQTKDIVILWDIIKLTELKKKPGFSAQTLWRRVGRDILAIISSADDPYTYYPTELPEQALIDMFGSTIITKPKALTTMVSSGIDSSPVDLYTIFTPDTTDFTNCTIRLSFDTKHVAGFEVEGPSASSFVDEHVNILDLVAPITLSSTQSTVTANSSISVTVNSQPYIDEVYLESVSGILNKTRVKLTNGVGKFSIMTTDLEVGEEVRVKAGHRKWTGIASFTKILS